MQIPTDTDQHSIEQAAKHWRYGSGIHAAAMDTGLTVEVVAKLYALWDVVRHERRRAGPPKPTAAPHRP